MKFLDDIFKRKVPVLAVVSDSTQSTARPREEWEMLQDEIDAEQSQLAQLEADAHQAGAELAEIAGTAANLKIELSAGSPSASTALDALESRQRAAERRHQGLGLRIATLCAGIEPKKRRAASLALLRDAMRQDQVVSDLTARASAMTAEVLHHWRASCAVGYDLMVMLDSAIGGLVPLDEEHKRQLLVLNTMIGKAFLAASCAQANEHWQFARPDSFHNLKVIPGKPRDGIRTAPAVAGTASVEDREVSGLAWSHPGQPHPPVPRTLPRSIAG
jgi:hypothetical protein